MKRTTPLVCGINTGHDGGAAIWTPDTVIAIGEERLNRNRYSPGWQASLLYCLQALDLQLDDVALFVASGIGLHEPELEFVGLQHLGVDPARVVTVDHHLAHAYSAYCLSGHDEAAVLVVDGAGNNGDTETYYVARQDGIERIGGNDPRRPRAGGVGATYEAFTNHLGWHEQEAGKTMALAAYGDPSVYQEPLFELDGDQVRGRLTQTHAPGVGEFAARVNLDVGVPDSHGHTIHAANTAAYVQHETERALIHLTDEVLARTGQQSLCIAGGTALNCLANQEIRSRGSCTDLFVPPPASDRGQALGAAFYGAHRLTGELPRRPLADDGFGRTYDEREIARALRRDPRSGLVERRRAPFKWRHEPDIAVTAAQMIADGRIIGWFDGRSELGPRSLGHRSILADPRTTASMKALNGKVKHRESFRPFAPAVLLQHAAEWFDHSGPSPFMLLAPAVRAIYQDRIPSVVHIDGTSRIQTVSTRENFRFASMIGEFHRITGVPMVLNTSFNDQEPIVETPAHALATFQATDLDALCIGDYLVERPDGRTMA